MRRKGRKLRRASEEGKKMRKLSGSNKNVKLKSSGGRGRPRNGLVFAS